jgi:hypothetical protein
MTTPGEIIRKLTTDALAQCDSAGQSRDALGRARRPPRPRPHQTLLSGRQRLCMRLCLPGLACLSRVD